jgi:hypothetical protein
VGDALLGAPAMSGFRRRLATVDTAHVAPGTLLYQLLDDLPGATIVSDFARRMWSVYEEIDPDGSPRNPRRVLGLCTGFTPGSSGLNPDGSSTGFHHTTAVATLPRSDDELSWHDFDEPSVMSMRRARRTDVWIEAGEITVDAMFQDSCTAPLGGRAAIHQYTVRATADLATQQITFLDATPGNLPYDECPLAVRNVGRLVGSPLAELRGAVAGELKGTAGCTHLNDALRSLADVPVLLRELDECRAG